MKAKYSICYKAEPKRQRWFVAVGGYFCGAEKKNRVIPEYNKSRDNSFVFPVFIYLIPYMCGEKEAVVNGITDI